MRFDALLDRHERALHTAAASLAGVRQLAALARQEEAAMASERPADRENGLDGPGVL